MDIPKPGSWIKKPAMKPKVPYILKPHLTDRPLAHDEGLSRFRDQIFSNDTSEFGVATDDENGETK